MAIKTSFVTVEDIDGNLATGFTVKIRTHHGDEKSDTTLVDQADLGPFPTEEAAKAASREHLKAWSDKTWSDIKRASADKPSSRLDAMIARNAEMIARNDAMIARNDEMIARTDRLLRNLEE